MAEKRKVEVELELNFPGDLKGEPVFYHIIKKFDIIPNILEASFSTDMGWAIVTFAGDEKEIDQLLAYLKKTGVSFTHR